MRWSDSLILLFAAGSGAADRPRIAPAPPAVAPDSRPAPQAPVAPPADQAPPPELSNAAGPSGTSGTGAEGYDAVGYASWYGEELGGNRTATGERFDPAGVSAAHRTLPLGSYAEVTSLDSGRTIVVRINDRGPGRRDREIDLSRGAADQLGAKGAVVAVRVRTIVPSPADIAALRSGQAASPRLDAPPALLTALRKQLPGGAEVVAVVPPAPVQRPRSPVAIRAPVSLVTPEATKPSPPPVQAAPLTRGRFAVQVGTFSSEARARALAKSLGGSVRQFGSLWRVRLGPYPDSASAKRARDGAARRGYGDAQIQSDP